VEESDRDTAHWNAFVRVSLRNESIRDSIEYWTRAGITAGVHLSNYDDSRWPVCHLPVNMESLNLFGHWGYFWFRKTFVISSTGPLTDYILEVPLSGQSYQVYINGTQMEITRDPVTQKNTWPVPASLLNKGNNLLAIRLLVHWGSGGIGQKNVWTGLVPSDESSKIALDGEWRYNSGIEPAIPQRQDYFTQNNVLFNAMIAPVIPYGIKGVIWYQGEANAWRGYLYRTLLPMLIEDWRIRWEQGSFPFLYVQLANFRAKKPSPCEDSWADIRESQFVTLDYPKTGMAVAIDIGDSNDIHPRNKTDVGKRLSLWARYLAYGEDIVYSGPLYKSMTLAGAAIRISFNSAGSGLVSKDGMPLKGFAIAGEDHTFVWASAVIEGNEVVVHSPEVSKPVAVRYSWEINPDGNLYNREGLPASPFRTDTWKLGTQK
jgi:sialate O-acetylesterase